MKSEADSGAPVEAPATDDLAALAATPIEQARFLEARGYFDRAFYLEMNPDIAASQIEPFEHFYFYGFREGRRPNIAFDARWYLETHADVREAGANCLLHYALAGEAEGRRPNALFAL